MEFKLEKTWANILKDELSQDYLKELESFICEEMDRGKQLYPQFDNIFEAFNSTPFPKVKVVILGQDPYHSPGQAHGLSFSVKPGTKIPPSLKNIYKELQNDLGVPPAHHGYLQSWAEQGVLLLNSVLTVEQGKAGSHQKRGWEKFTNKVIQVLNDKKENLIFILWGTPAQKKGQLIDEEKHLVLKSVHPSPLSAHRGFFHQKHFSKTNEFLKSKNLNPIHWELPTLEKGNKI
jgi:uracil-DNA glycosylase